MILQMKICRNFQSCTRRGFPDLTIFKKCWYKTLYPISYLTCKNSNILKGQILLVYNVDNVSKISKILLKSTTFDITFWFYFANFKNQLPIIIKSIVCIVYNQKLGKSISLGMPIIIRFQKNSKVYLRVKDILQLPHCLNSFWWSWIMHMFGFLESYSMLGTDATIMLA